MYLVTTKFNKLWRNFFRCGSLDMQGRIKPSWPPCQISMGPLSPFQFLIPFPHPLSEVFSSVIKFNNTPFRSVLNLR